MNEQSTYHFFVPMIIDHAEFIGTKSTHLHLDKMATISQTIFSDAISWMKILIKISFKFAFHRPYFQMQFREWKVLHFDKKNSFKFVPKGPIDNNPALV